MGSQEACQPLDWHGKGHGVGGVATSEALGAKAMPTDEKSEGKRLSWLGKERAKRKW
ncbi:MAG: hypothetical protein RR769_07320 [Anaerovoracaceae bacterium]